MEQIFDISIKFDLHPRYNIAPTQNVLVISESATAEVMKWGLIPSWAKDPKISYKLINARSETVTIKPSFRDAVKKRRCLIPADGFFEWKKEAGAKQSYYFSRASEKPFAFAGLWEEWENPATGKSIKSCTILTKNADPVVYDVHGRMPVILSAENYDAWISSQTPIKVVESLWSANTVKLTVNRVSKIVNSPNNDSPLCIESPMSEETV